ncbi:MAG: DUF58 domain-containing protein [Candidatus Omnitrophica bacterium]|nr:DUF58 domain-containing protein [Candidatus Omnitrophota bacterium]
MPFLILVLFLIAFVLRVDFVFYIAYVCMGLYAWSRWYPPRALRLLDVQRSFANRVFLGETVSITLRLHNQQRWGIPWLQLYESVPLELRTADNLNQVITLPGQETAVLHYTLQANRRGYYQVGPTALQTGDLFGFFPVHTAACPANYLTVYPRIIPFSQLGLPSRLPFGTVASHQRLFADPARPMGVRDFRSGDSLRQINWKVSGHTRQLMVKTFQPAISLETAVLLNLHNESYNRQNRWMTVEWAIELAASLKLLLYMALIGCVFFPWGIAPANAGVGGLGGALTGDYMERKENQARSQGYYQGYNQGYQQGSGPMAYGGRQEPPADSSW